MKNNLTVFNTDIIPVYTTDGLQGKINAALFNSVKSIRDIGLLGKGRLHVSIAEQFLKQIPRQTIGKDVINVLMKPNVKY